MGLFKKRKSRATRRAEARALKAKAKLEAKLAAKNEGKRIKSVERTGKKAVKAQTSGTATAPPSRWPKPSFARPARESCWRPDGSGAR